MLQSVYNLALFRACIFADLYSHDQRTCKYSFFCRQTELNRSPVTTQPWSLSAQVPRTTAILGFYQVLSLDGSAVQDTILKIVSLSLPWRYKIVSYLVSSRYFLKVSWQRGRMEDTFKDTFHKILFVHCVRYSSRIISQTCPCTYKAQYTGMHIIITWLHGMTIILEHKSSNNSESTNACKTNITW